MADFKQLLKVKERLILILAIGLIFLLYYLKSKKVIIKEQVIDLLVSDRTKETLGPACLCHVFSTEGMDWYGPEKLTDVFDTYENSQMYLPSKQGCARDLFGQDRDKT